MTMKPLEPLEAIPVTHGVALTKVDPNARYIVFMDDHLVNQTFIDGFTTDTNNPLPAGTPIYVVDDIDRAVKIYEILDTKVGSSGS